jgi:hypothetical protein
MWFQNHSNSLPEFNLASGKTGKYYALSALEAGETTPVAPRPPLLVEGGEKKQIFPLLQ